MLTSLLTCPQGALTLLLHLSSSSTSLELLSKLNWLCTSHTRPSPPPSFRLCSFFFFFLMNHFKKWSESGGSDSKEFACSIRELGSIPGQEDPLEKGMATHSSICVQRIPWAEEPGRLQSMGLQRLFLAALALGCCVRAFSGCAERGSSPVAVRWRLLLQNSGSRHVGSLVVMHRFGCPTA